ncbi:MAG: hypothetical protein AAB426_00200, partial [Myxococcota bacterium]
MMRRPLALLVVAMGVTACARAPSIRVAPDFGAPRDGVFYGPEPVVTSPDDELLPSIAMRQGEVAYAAKSAGNLDIFVRPVLGGAPQRLTTSPTDDTDPTFSPEGTVIAWVSQAEDIKGDVWLMSAAGGAQRRLTGPETADRAPAWSADGTALYFTARAPGRGKERIDVITLADGARRTVLENAWDAAPSPDGRFLFYVTLDGAQRSRIFALRLRDGKRVATTDGAYVEALPR